MVVNTACIRFVLQDFGKIVSCSSRRILSFTGFPANVELFCIIEGQFPRNCP